MRSAAVCDLSAVARRARVEASAAARGYASPLGVVRTRCGWPACRQAGRDDTAALRKMRMAPDGLCKNKCLTRSVILTKCPSSSSVRRERESRPRDSCQLERLALTTTGKRFSLSHRMGEGWGEGSGAMENRSYFCTDPKEHGRHPEIRAARQHSPTMTPTIRVTTGEPRNNTHARSRP